MLVHGLENEKSVMVRQECATIYQDTVSPTKRQKKMIRKWIQNRATTQAYRKHIHGRAKSGTEKAHPPASNYIYSNPSHSVFVRRLYLRDMAQVKRYAGSNIPSIRPVKGGGLSFDIMVRKCSNSGLTSLNAYWEEKMQEEVYIVRARISLT